MKQTCLTLNSTNKETKVMVQKENVSNNFQRILFASFMIQ